MTGRGWRLLTLCSAVVTGAALAAAPVIATSSCTTTSSGKSSCTSGRETLLHSEGAGVLVALAVPALVAVVPVVIQSYRATLLAACALSLAALLAGASIGIFFFPTVGLAWASVRASRPSNGKGKDWSRVV